MKLLSVFMIGILIFTGCNKESDNPTEPVQPNHTFIIQNSTYYAPKQLACLEVIPVGGSALISEEFIFNVGYNKDIKILIPSTGLYKVQIFSSDGQSMWWNSFGLELGDQTYLKVTCGGGVT